MGLGQGTNGRFVLETAEARRAAREGGGSFADGRIGEKEVSDGYFAWELRDWVAQTSPMAKQASSRGRIGRIRKEAILALSLQKKLHRGEDDVLLRTTEGRHEGMPIGREIDRGKGDRGVEHRGTTGTLTSAWVISLLGRGGWANQGAKGARKIPMGKVN